MYMQEGWKTVASKSLVKDRWIDLRADQCITPNGQEISPYYVLTYSDWINVVAITPDEQVLLTRQYRHAAGHAFWEIPGGGIDPNDPDPCSAAGRELEEETGYRAEKIELVTTLFPNPASHTNRLHPFLASNVTPIGTQQLEAGEEGLTVHKMPIRELVERLHDGFLGQALHTSSVLMALLVSGRIKAALP
ncbi:hydrolase protein [Rhizobium rhizogenes K84]|uniref:Hydrolase protein n=2 Tax=Rhizobium rhizogenes TaxID=359 RepID=B9J9D7_RHIR8|nr:hydrolase protein [Rhizobium rhizogenes K84]